MKGAIAAYFSGLGSDRFVHKIVEVHFATLDQEKVI